MSRLKIFISSVQKELAAERLAIRSFVESDALLRRFFDVFLFEDVPASSRRADEVYLAEVDACDVYLGLFGNEYGFEDASGVSPTEREFDQATAQGKTRLIFVKGSDDRVRHPKMQALVRKAGAQLIRRRFSAIPELTAALSASLVERLASKGLVQDRPFEDQPCPDATLDDLDPNAIAAFVRRAREERQFPLSEGAALPDVLTHLNLLSGGQPTKAAVLLFGRSPQRFLPSAEVRCMHFHGTEIVRPVPFYRIFKGHLFEQVDTALDFVLSKLDRSVGTRAESVQAPVRHEVPPDVVREAIVNAIAHRDYSSSAAVQVSVFADRVEVWNPGQLPSPLTPERLRHPHSSIARNHRICEVLFLARYIEKFGTGTLMMIRESLAHALPEPDFVQQAGELVTTVWRDWLTEKVVNALGLNERQRLVCMVVKTAGRVTNTIYQQTTGASRPTAIRDLAKLVTKGVFIRHGAARSAYYTIAEKRLKHDSNDSPERSPAIESEMTQMTRARLKVPARKSAINRPIRPSAQTRPKPAKPDTAKPASTRPAPNKPGQAAKPDARKGKAK
jgi:predicted HTH transcriptional regulator